MHKSLNRGVQDNKTFSTIKANRQSVFTGNLWHFSSLLAVVWCRNFFIYFLQLQSRNATVMLVANNA